eukprot:COSAG01_NODE_13301_length_1604_cov_5.611960_2_plen_118_part_00
MDALSQHVVAVARGQHRVDRHHQARVLGVQALDRLGGLALDAAHVALDALGVPAPARQLGQLGGAVFVSWARRCLSVGRGGVCQLGGAVFVSWEGRTLLLTCPSPAARCPSPRRPGR